MIKIQCPSCNSESQFSLSDPSYVGPFRCWKCRKNYTLKMDNNQVVSMDPMSDIEYETKYPKKHGAY